MSTYVRPPLHTATFRDDDGAPIPYGTRGRDLDGPPVDTYSVAVDAGLEHHDSFPGCGCDACDEAIEDSADTLEQLVLGVAGGSLHEWVRRTWPGARDVRVGSAVGRGWDAAGTEGLRRLSRAEVRRVQGRLRALPDGAWQPWPRRDTPPARRTSDRSPSDGG